MGLTLLREGKIDLVINVPDSMDSQALTDGFEVRRAAVDSGVSLIVDMKVAILTTLSLYRKWSREKSGKAFWSDEPCYASECASWARFDHVRISLHRRLRWER